MIKDIYRIPIMEGRYENDELKNHFLNILNNYKTENKSVNMSNCGGFQTPSINGLTYNLAFKEPVNSFLSSFKRRTDFEWSIGGLWINQNFKNDFNRPHSHFANYNHYSGIWYLKAPRRSGNLVFFTRPDNSDCTHTWDFIDDISAETNYVVVPKEYDIYLWPS